MHVLYTSLIHFLNDIMTHFAAWVQFFHYRLFMVMVAHLPRAMGRNVTVFVDCSH